MNRRQTNRIRTVLEDWVPPVLRDSGAFRWLAKRAWGEHIDHLADFRARAPFLTDAEYKQLYEHHPRVHEGTDNSEACIARMAEDVVGASVIDIGCGTGELLRRLKDRCEGPTRCVGVDFAINDADALPGIEFLAAKVESLPFPDNSFDTVICTHVVEHVLEPKKAIAELRRICARRLIIVVPREREYRYTFNPHFNFFPYTHSFLRTAHPVPETFVCEDIQRDIYYREDVVATSEPALPLKLAS